jgi:hypothetical protein
MNNILTYEEWHAAFADGLEVAEQCNGQPFDEATLRGYYAEYLNYQQAYRGGHDL